MPQDWDVYRHGLTGRTFYYNCVEGISQWKPPRKAKETIPFSLLPCDPIQCYVMVNSYPTLMNGLRLMVGNAHPLLSLNDLVSLQPGTNSF